MPRIVTPPAPPDIEEVADEDLMIEFHHQNPPDLLALLGKLD